MKDNQLITRLLDSCSPEQWKDFLFEIQNRLIEVGHVEVLTRQGTKQFAARFYDLHEFFSELQTRKKTVVNS